MFSRYEGFYAFHILYMNFSIFIILLEVISVSKIQSVYFQRKIWPPKEYIMSFML